MKLGIRKPSIKRSIKTRTTGKLKRKVKRATNPFYGKKGTGWVKNPKKAAYNKVYNKTSTSAASAAGGIGQLFKGIGLLYVGLFAGIVWVVKAIIGLFNPKKTTGETTKPIGHHKASSPQAKSPINVTITTHTATPDELEAQRLDKVEEIRKLDSTAHLSENGLTPSEILLLSHAGGCRTDNNFFPRFWFYDYGISDPQVILNKLFAKGLIQIASAKESLVLVDYREIQAKLKSLGLPATGKKEILIERLANAVSPEELERIATSRMYVLTDLGKTEVAQNEYIPYLHEHSDLHVSIWEINRQLHEHPGSRWRDCVWGELNKSVHESMHDIERGDYFQYTQAKERTVKYLMDERRYRIAVQIAAEISYYEINKDAVKRYLMELKNHHLVAEPRMRRVKDPVTGKSKLIKDDSPPSLEAWIFLAPYKKQRYETIMHGLSLDAEGLRTLLIDAQKQFCTPSDIFSASEIADIILADLRGDGELISNICAEAEKRVTGR